MNQLYEPNSALFGVLVAHARAPATVSAGGEVTRARSSGLVLAALGVALLTVVCWIVLA
jgi:hypothetical protein